MFCTKCGIVLKNGDSYCSQCGTATGRDTLKPAYHRERLTRSVNNKKIAGVCGGLAEYLAVDPTLIRLIWLVMLVCFPPILLGYIAAWIVMPKEPARLPAPLSPEPSPLV